jgi:hypothetical protein
VCLGCLIIICIFFFYLFVYLSHAPQEPRAFCVSWEFLTDRDPALPVAHLPPVYFYIFIFTFHINFIFLCL